jgi:glutamyl endopeptidase
LTLVAVQVMPCACSPRLASPRLLSLLGAIALIGCGDESSAPLDDPARGAVTAAPRLLSRSDPRAQLPPRLREVEPFPNLSASAANPGPAPDTTQPLDTAHVRFDRETGVLSRVEAASGETPFAAGAHPDGSASDTPAGPEQIGSSAAPVIIGSDDRVQVHQTHLYPASANVIVFARFSNGTQSWEHFCSSSLIGRRFVLTAAHCLYDNTLGGYLVDSVVVPGLDGSYMPFGSTTHRSAVVSARWYNDIGSADHATSAGLWPTAGDWGGLELVEAIGLATGWLGMYSIPFEDWDFVQLATYGYAGDFPNPSSGFGQAAGPDKTGRTMLSVNAAASGTYDGWTFRHFLDIIPGQSGSAVTLSGSRDLASGIQSYHSSGSGSTNGATRLTAPIISTLSSLAADTTFGTGFRDVIQWRGQRGDPKRPLNWGRHTDGTMRLFASSWDGRLYTRRRSPSGVWDSGYTVLGTGVTDLDISVVSHTTGTISYAWVERSTRHLWVGGISQAVAMPTYDLGIPAGATIDDAPTLVSWGDGDLDAFVTAVDGTVWHRPFRTGYGWYGWGSLGGSAQGRVAAVARGSGVLELAAWDRAARIWVKSYDPALGGWYPSQAGWILPPASPLCSTPPTMAVVGSGATSILRVLCTKFDGELPRGEVWAATRAGAGGSAWISTNLSGSAEGSVRAAGAADRRVSVWARNAWDHRLYRRDSVNGAWEPGWTPSSLHYTTEAPSVFALPDSTFALAHRAVDEPLPFNQQTAGTVPVFAWTALYQPGTALNGAW